MQYWITFYYMAVIVCALPKDAENEVTCPSSCVGDEHECINGKCYCADGYIMDYKQGCTKCPGLGEKCFGFCCNQSLNCWQGVCQSCQDSHGKWVCRDAIDQILLISITQVVMATALVLGIIATFVLLYKLCSASNLRPMGSMHNRENRLSVGSMQIYVDERLRDAPPRYSSTAPSGSSIYPALSYLNAGFVHDSTVPPPPYSPEIKNEENHNVTNHI